MSTEQDRARAALAAIEAAAEELTALHDLHDGIGEAANHAGSATVALLSLLPFVVMDDRGLDFFSDCMNELTETVTQLTRTQAAGMALVKGATLRADAARDNFSVRV